MTIHEQIDAFYRFALDALKSQSFNSVEEVLDRWRLQHPSPEAAAEDLAAVQAAIGDMERGDRGRPADEVLAEMQAKHNLPDIQ